MMRLFERAMSSTSVRGLMRCAAILILTNLLASFAAAEESFNLQDLIKETQRIEQNENVLKFVWWIPSEYWRASFENVPTLSVEQKDEFCRVMDDYIVFAVIDAHTNMFGSVVSLSSEKVAEKLRFRIGRGEVMSPLSDTQISSDARTMFEMMKPLLGNMLGQFGQGMNFYCFKGKNAKGVRILDPIGKERITLSLGESDFMWRLPLGSLLPPKYDRATGEQFPGNYLYNPFTGDLLTTDRAEPGR